MEFSSDSNKRSSLKLISTAGHSDVLQQLSWPAASQRAKTKNELNSRQKELIYPSEAFTAHLVKHWWF